MADDHRLPRTDKVVSLTRGVEPNIVTILDILAMVLGGCRAVLDLNAFSLYPWLLRHKISLSSHGTTTVDKMQVLMARTLTWPWGKDEDGSIKKKILKQSTQAG